MKMSAIACCALGVLAASSASPHSEDKARAGELVRLVREATVRYRDPNVAEAEGYHLLFGCVSGPDSGAMGLHYVNMSLVGDGALDATRPEIVIYEPLPNGRLRLVGARRCLTAEGTNAHILYRVDGRPLSLYLVPDDSRAAATLDVLGRDAVVWSGDNGTYVLVGEHGRGDAERVASYMQRVTARPGNSPEEGGSIRQ